jgi:hypothetical protein
MRVLLGVYYLHVITIRMWIPYELRNLILSYTCDEPVCPYYDIVTGREMYRINWEAEHMIHLRAVLMTRFIYPGYLFYPDGRVQTSIYTNAIAYYESLIRDAIRN